MKSLYGILAAGALLGATSAWAVKPGGTLYIKSKGVKLLKDPKAGAATVGAELKVGAAVIWNKASDKDKQFHEIEADGKKGFVLMTNLSPSVPQEEVLDAKGTKQDAQAYASSASASRGLSPGAVKYATGEGAEPTDKQAAVQLIYSEEHSKKNGTDDKLKAKAKELGGGK